MPSSLIRGLDLVNCRCTRLAFEVQAATKSFPLLLFNGFLRSMDSKHHRVIQVDGNRSFETLEDILPDGTSSRGMKLTMLIIAKRPAPDSVRQGHYFQGTQGSAFWNKLREYGIIQVPENEYEDDYLLSHGYGMMDIVKVPGEFGDEPSNQEYESGMDRIKQSIKVHEPAIILFVYKRPLEQLLKAVFNNDSELMYGFNPGLNHHFRAKVFLFPMPGAGRRVTEEVIHCAMSELRRAICETKNSPMMTLEVGGSDSP